MIKKILAFASALCLVSTAAADAPDKRDKTDENISFTPTVSAAGSVSKVFCVTAAMQLYDRGLLDIEKPVTQYIPEFTMQDERYEDITVRMLMDHTSGLMGFAYGDDMLYDEAEIDYHDRFLEVMSRQHLKADPGTMATYSNDSLTLLEIVVERVSGESFTEYVDEHICKPMGLEKTGTSLNMTGRDDAAQILVNGDIRYATDYCMAFGSGGIVSTSDDLSKFGTAFYDGDDTLLSQASKDEMAKTAARERYEEGFGLGWDTVDFFNECGMDTDAKVLFKGGALNHQFAGLMVAPEEDISVAVTMSGGGAGEVTMMSRELMKSSLKEQGTEIGSDMPKPVQTVENIPEKYTAMADIYANIHGIFSVDFPDGKYMEITELTSDTPKPVRYMYTTDDSFVRMKGEYGAKDFVLDSDREELTFTEREGITYIGKYENLDFDGMGRYINKDYYLQRAGAAEVSDEVQKAWQQRDGTKYYVSSAKYSNAYYFIAPSVKIKVPEGADGYGKLAVIDKTVRFADADKAEGFVHIPGEAGRDLEDFELFTEGGCEYLRTQDKALTLISEKDIPYLTADMHGIALEKGKAKWYNIGEMGSKPVTLDIPEKAAVYVYDKYDKVIYSSYMKDYGNKVTLPREGRIVFIGEDGAEVGIG